MSTRELCKCWISIFLFFGQTVKEAQVRSIQSRFFKSIFARWNIKQNILFYWEHKVWLLWYLTLLFFHYEAWNKAMYFMPEFPRILLPSFLFFFNLEHTQEVQSKLIKSGHLENFIFLKKKIFLHLNISGWFSYMELPILRPQVLPLALCPMWKLWVNWHLCCQAWLWLEERQVLQDGLLWQLRAASQRPGIFWTTEGLKNVGRDKLLGSDLHNHHSDKPVCCCSTAYYFARRVWYQIQLEKIKIKIEELKSQLR